MFFILEDVEIFQTIDPLFFFVCVSDVWLTLCHRQADTGRVNAAIDPRGESLALDPDATDFLDARNPASTMHSSCPRGFPSGYNPAVEHRRQGIHEASLSVVVHAYVALLVLVGELTPPENLIFRICCLAQYPHNFNWRGVFFSWKIKTWKINK